MPRTRASTTITIAFISLAAFTYWLFFRDETTLCAADPEVCPCLALIPDYRTFGITYETDETGKVSKIAFGGDQQRKNDPSPELAEQFVQCVQDKRGSIEVLNYSRLGASPLGQIANVWKRSGGMSIELRPPDSEIIQNLQIGPVSGLRWDIVGEFCATASSCVTCDPAIPSSDAVSVLISLKPDSPTRKEKVGTGFSNPHKPWELMDEAGDRYFYLCGN